MSDDSNDKGNDAVVDKHLDVACVEDLAFVSNGNRGAEGTVA